MAECKFATRRKLLSIRRKINLIHIKTEFFANYISVYKNCEQETHTYNMPHQKLCLATIYGKYRHSKSLMRPIFCQSNFHVMRHCTTCRDMPAVYRNCAALMCTLFSAKPCFVAFCLTA